MCMHHFVQCICSHNKRFADGLHKSVKVLRITAHVTWCVSDVPEQVRCKAEGYTGTWTIDDHLRAISLRAFTMTSTDQF